MPKILFEVASYDSWNRYRTEGYTWTQLPMKPGYNWWHSYKFICAFLKKN